MGAKGIDPGKPDESGMLRLSGGLIKHLAKNQQLTNS